MAIVVAEAVTGCIYVVVAAGNNGHIPIEDDGPTVATGSAYKTLVDNGLATATRLARLLIGIAMRIFLTAKGCPITTSCITLKGVNGSDYLLSDRVGSISVNAVCSVPTDSTPPTKPSSITIAVTTRYAIKARFAGETTIGAVVRKIFFAGVFGDGMGGCNAHVLNKRRSTGVLTVVRETDFAIGNTVGSAIAPVTTIGIKVSTENSLCTMKVRLY